MSYTYKIISTKSPPCLYKLIPRLPRSHRYTGCFKTMHCRTELFRHSILPFTVNEWNKLVYAIFRKKLLAFIKSEGNKIYGIYDPFGVRVINRLRLGSVIYENISLDIILSIL